MTRPSIEIARKIVGWACDERESDIIAKIAAAIDQRDKEWGELVAGLREAAEINPREIMKAFYAGDLGHMEQVCDEVVLDIINRTLKAGDRALSALKGGSGGI